MYIKVPELLTLTYVLYMHIDVYTNTAQYSIQIYEYKSINEHFQTGPVLQLSVDFHTVQHLLNILSQIWAMTEINKHIHTQAH